jgi:hypothetical protein
MSTSLQEIFEDVSEILILNNLQNQQELVATD